MKSQYLLAPLVNLAMEQVLPSHPFGGKVKTANLNAREQRSVS